jgi:hypothetical protein
METAVYPQTLEQIHMPEEFFLHNGDIPALTAATECFPDPTYEGYPDFIQGRIQFDIGNIGDRNATWRQQPDGSASMLRAQIPFAVNSLLSLVRYADEHLTGDDGKLLPTLPPVYETAALATGRELSLLENEYMQSPTVDLHRRLQAKKSEMQAAVQPIAAWHQYWNAKSLLERNGVLPAAALSESRKRAA